MNWLDDPPRVVRMVLWGAALVGLYLWLASIGVPVPIPGGGQ